MNQRTLLLLSVTATAITAAGQPPAASFRLEEVLRAAVSTAQAGEARLDLARTNLHYLETLDKWRFELRPSLGLFAFSNPALLATNLGTGLLLNRRTAPGPAAMDNARFDALAAEVSSENLKVRVQLDAARAYFDLLGKQQVARLASETLDLRRGKGGEVERFLAANRITSAEKLAFQEDLLDLETSWLNAESERKAASARLALLMGKPEIAGTLTVADVDPVVLAVADTVPAVENLVKLALQHRAESKLMREKLGALERSRTPRKKVAVETAGAGYSYIGNRSGLANTLDSNILGGNTGRGELTLNIPLKDTGERAAHDAVTAARAKLLRLEIAAMEDSVRVELVQLQDAAGSNLEKLRLATRRLDLARKAAEVAKARAEAGLAPLTTTWSADHSLLRAESAYMLAEYERKSSLYALLVVCGVDQPAASAGGVAQAR